MCIEACLADLRAGRLVAFPTDTLYALSCDPFSAPALARLRAVKGLSAGRPLPLLIPPGFDLHRVHCLLNETARALAEAFWPGKLTLVVPCHGPLGAAVGRADGWVGLRVPAGPWIQKLLLDWDGPLVGTSANPTGAPPAATAAEAERYFAQDEVRVLPGEAPGGAPSTVVIVGEGRIQVERAGAVPLALLSRWCPSAVP